MTITVYSKSDCVQCTATYRALDRAQLDFEVVNLEDNPQALETVKELGYQQAPVVITDDEHWSGFRPDKISELSQRRLNEVQAECAERRDES